MTALKIARIISAGNVHAWGQSLNDGNLCLVLEVHGSEENPAVKIGESIIHSLKIKNSSHPITNLETLKQTLELVRGKTHIKTLLLGVFIENVIYIGLHGDGEAIIKRDGKALSLIKKDGVLSGHTKDGDLFIFANESAKKILETEEYKTVILNENEEKIEEILTPSALNPENPGFAALIVAKEKKQEQIPESSPLPLEHTHISSQPENEYTELSNLPSEEYQKEESGRKFTAPNIQGIKNSIFSFVKEKILQEDTYEEVNDPKKKRTKMILISIAALLLLLFAISVGFGINSQFGSVKKDDYIKTVELVSHKFDEAVSLIDLNPKRSRDLLNEAQKETKKLLSNLPENSIEAKDIKELLTKIENQIIVASRVYKQEDPPVLFDLSIIREGAKGQNIALYEDQIVVLDNEGKRLYTLTKDGKQGEVIAGPDVIKDAKNVSIHGGNAYVVNTDGIRKIDTNSSNVATVVDNDKEWGTLGPIFAYAGNLYLLDKSKNQIWKYIATETGFTERKNYLEDDVQVNLSDAKSMSIDGSIWVLNGNEVAKLTQGRLDVYTMTDGLEEVLEIDALSTNEDAENIYLLDAKKGQVIVYTKEGKYKETYESKSIKGAQDLVVIEPEKKILVLKDSKIYSIDIK